MPDIVLTTLNARYVHASFGLRYLRANLGELRERSIILEFEASQRTVDVLERILAVGPKIVGVGVYIWNAVPSLQLVAELKRVRPDIVVVLGGPEVSHETNEQEVCRLADYVITGEADRAFAELCRQVLSNRRPLMRIIRAELPAFLSTATPTAVRSDLGSQTTSDPAQVGVVRSDRAAVGLADACADAVVLPYNEYTPDDLAHRVVYVEASRGCPFSCEFCLSSLDVPVRNVPLEPFLAAMAALFDRGCRQFKFVDRTFNLNLTFARSILRFFLDRYEPGLFVHFEMVPDRLPEGLREIIRLFPAGSLQFEVGIQTFNPDVEKLISRRQDHARLDDNLRWLRRETGVHVHADLIVGLPGEDVASFGRGFDRLVGLGPQEIQVGILKRLRGTPITRHDAEWGMVYSPAPPYEILQTKLVGFAEMQRMRRFSRYWDLVANSGSFAETLRLMLADAPFDHFLGFADWVWERNGRRTHGIALHTLAELVFEHLTTARGMANDLAADAIVGDFNRTRRDAPARIVALANRRPDLRGRKGRVGPSRQARHRDAPSPAATIDAR